MTYEDLIMKTIQSIDRAILLLEYISKHQGCRLIDMCTHYNLNKSTLHGILSTLEIHGLITKDMVSSTYSLGSKVYELGQLYQENFAIKKIARPYLVKLAEQFKETVHLAVLNNLSVLYIDKVESPHAFRVTSKVGTTDPLLTTAIGKSLLSSLSDERLDYILESLLVTSFAESIELKKQLIIKELSFINECGIALDCDELEKGLSCIAVSIKNKINETVAAISISAPTSRFNKENLESMKKALMDTSSRIYELL